MVGHHLIQVQLSLRAVVADPMHKLAAAKGGVVGMNAICSIALIVSIHAKSDVVLLQMLAALFSFQ